MKNPCENPYKLARMIAGLNQEDAAFLLHISTRTLSEYERGAVRPHDDIVEKMIEVYNTPWLAYAHFKTSSLGKFLPSIKFESLEKAFLRLQKELKDVQQMSDETLDIVIDGKIDKKEEKAWERYLKEVLEAASAAMSLIFSRGAVRG